MTKNEFFNKINEQLEKYKNTILNTKSAEEIYDMADEITKMEKIADFIFFDVYYDWGDDFIEKLYPYADNLLQELYDFECNYDELQWTSDENLDRMFSDYILWKEGEEV